VVANSYIYLINKPTRFFSTSQESLFDHIHINVLVVTPFLELLSVTFWSCSHWW